MLNMRSMREVTARTAIRDAALRLFAEHGAAKVSVRQIAAAAEVSPALVLHHFGSKEGLVAGVDAHVVGIVERFADAFDAVDIDRIFAGDSESAVSAMTAAFPPGSPELAYVPRMLLEGGDSGRALFAHWHAYTVRVLADWETAGVVRPGPDREALAAFMLTADLGLMMLRDHVSATIGDDPFGDGLQRWTDTVVRAYGGLFGDRTTTEGRPSAAGSEAGGSDD
jgi:TetR/AcrR family transcriptional regulator, regulator of cefoperazone and chloramphenicol sensitivity